ncbi:hypothetical protein JL721_8864 [Aureococcus anophagefferens]|nr:hypothetical protein JL721_8864 [Aureococcus anophagefferens]
MDALPEMASPLGQMIVLGCVFFLVFASYYMEQGFASDLFGATLAWTLVALYAAFTVGCFFAPCGQIYLAIAAADDRADAGRLFSVFWCLFNASAVAGGLVTFAYFSTSSSGGDAPLYALFTLFIAEHERGLFRVLQFDLREAAALGAASEPFVGWYVASDDITVDETADCVTAAVDHLDGPAHNLAGLAGQSPATSVARARLSQKGPRPSPGTFAGVRSRVHLAELALLN